MEFEKAARIMNRMWETYQENPADAPLAHFMYADSPYYEDWATWLMYHPQEGETQLRMWDTLHPEPIYPTFAEWLEGIIHDNKELSALNLCDVLSARMPPEIAKQFNVAPLNPNKCADKI